jgi:hypothetical protein
VRGQGPKVAADAQIPDGIGWKMNLAQSGE